MAFNAQRNISNTRGNSNDESWKADGFINIRLSRKDGTSAKLGAIPLRFSKPNEAQLLKWLMEDPSRVEKLLGKMELDFRTAEPAQVAPLNLED